ncbi:complement factor I-like [Pelobates fuscus]|uniref:complement factor I-like n=1 Tax=Pelobates fuscus TaxID=191477 RepID=UPI002FE4A487
MKTLLRICALLYFICTVTSYEDTKACLTKKYTANSCSKVFCAPWQRCVDGRCICKLPYQCPKNITFSVCTEKKKVFANYCQLKSAECTNSIFRFSSEAPCPETFNLSFLKNEQGKKSGIIKVKVPALSSSSLLCSSGWTTKEANVACKQLGYNQGADSSAEQTFILPEAEKKTTDCLSVKCRGLETSLAECLLHKKTEIEDKRAGVVCYQDTRECLDNEFSCVNGKCIPSKKSCDGENDCGDLSDELCCTHCNGSFHCKSNTCIPNRYRCNSETDCIGGEDEAFCEEKNEDKTSKPIDGRSEKPQEKELEEEHIAVNRDMDEERRLAQSFIPTLTCGVRPQLHTRRKRIIGGELAVKNQFPWQVAIKDGNALNCGGIYIGGCWVLTAAHCVRANQPQKYRIMLELLNLVHHDQDIDSYPVKTVKVHEFYNPDTYENDIALLEVINIHKKPECMQYDNNLVAACVPWSPYQFMPGDRCVVSGWGRQEGLAKVFHLKYGHVFLMENCSSVYKERFLDKMECAGTYDGSIDACKGDSGGPLVCFDINNVAYVWGIVSWGENCGVAGYPGVYTKVAKYHEWISRIVGRSLISKYNT